MVDVVRQDHDAQRRRVREDAARDALAVERAELRLLPPEPRALDRRAEVHVDRQRRHEEEERLDGRARGVAARAAGAGVRKHLVELLLEPARVEPRARRRPRPVDEVRRRHLAVADEVDRQAGVGERADDLRHAREHAAAAARRRRAVVDLEEGHDHVADERRAVRRGRVGHGPVRARERDRRGPPRERRRDEGQRERRRGGGVRAAGAELAARQQRLEAPQRVAEGVEAALVAALHGPEVDVAARRELALLLRVLGALALAPPEPQVPPDAAQPAADQRRVAGHPQRRRRPARAAGAAGRRAARRGGSRRRGADPGHRAQQRPRDAVVDECFRVGHDAVDAPETLADQAPRRVGPERRRRHDVVAERDEAPVAAAPRGRARVRRRRRRPRETQRDGPGQRVPQHDDEARGPPRERGGGREPREDGRVRRRRARHAHDVGALRRARLGLGPRRRRGRVAAARGRHEIRHRVRSRQRQAGDEDRRRAAVARASRRRASARRAERLARRRPQRRQRIARVRRGGAARRARRCRPAARGAQRVGGPQPRRVPGLRRRQHEGGRARRGRGRAAQKGKNGHVRHTSDEQRPRAPAATSSDGAAPARSPHVHVIGRLLSQHLS